MYRWQTGACADLYRAERRMWRCINGRQQTDVM
jgi:hypothetical protein